MFPVYCASYERAVAAARAQLTEQEFTLRWTEGRAMPLDQVLAARATTTTPSLMTADAEPPTSRLQEAQGEGWG